MSKIDWQPEETAPTRTRVMAWCNNGPRWGYKDERGQWRMLHHQPFHEKPLKWATWPEGPEK